MTDKGKNSAVKGDDSPKSRDNKENAKVKSNDENKINNITATGHKESNTIEKDTYLNGVTTAENTSKSQNETDINLNSNTPSIQDDNSTAANNSTQNGIDISITDKNLNQIADNENNANRKDVNTIQGVVDDSDSNLDGNEILRAERKQKQNSQNENRTKDVTKSLIGSLKEPKQSTQRRKTNSSAEPRFGVTQEMIEEEEKLRVEQEKELNEIKEKVRWLFYFLDFTFF